MIYFNLFVDVINNILISTTMVRALLLLSVAFVATFAQADRILVLVDSLNVRETHSIFWKSLSGNLQHILTVISDF